MNSIFAVMAKKKKSKKKRAHTYEKKLKINGSFLDVVNALVDVDKKWVKKK